MSAAVGILALSAAAHLEPLVTTTEKFRMESPRAFATDTPAGDFEKAFRAVMAKDIEGGFVNDPNDPGGATNMGVSLREVRRLDADKKLSKFLFARFDVDKDGDIDERDVPWWDEALARDFYLEFYWNVIRGSGLPGPLAIVAFDSAVNEGTTKAAMHLQRCLGVATDGKVGPKTIAAAWAWRIKPGGLRPEEEVFMSRLERYASLRDQQLYFAGWARRSFKMLKVAQS